MHWLLDGQKGPSLHLHTRNKEQHQSTDVSLCSVTQSCQTLCDPVDCGPPGSSAHGSLRQEYESRFPFSTTGDLPNPGIKPESLVSPALAGRFFTTSATWEASLSIYMGFPGVSDSEGQGGLACCSPWCCKELDTTEQLNKKNIQRNTKKQ